MNLAGVRVLMSEGSSLSARESLTALGLAGCRVEVLDGAPLCLARFSSRCARVRPAPRFGDDPAGYLAAARDALRGGAFDALYPAHEQAYLFAAVRDELAAHAALALPDFDAFERVQSKVAFAGLLAELGAPAPPTEVAFDEAALRRAARPLPVYVKAAFGTATAGTFRVDDARGLDAAVVALRGALGDGAVVQRLVEGALGRAQAVFDRGRLAGLHACVQRREGVGGGDIAKESLDAAVVCEHVERLGARLGWHGGLSLDFILDGAGGPWFIDGNPRLVETGNALAAGLNLPALLVAVSLGRAPGGVSTGRAGVRTHMALQALLAAARARGQRRDVARALADVARRRGLFDGSEEELTPARGDALAAFPVAAVAAALMAAPSGWRAFAGGAVRAYAATPEVVRYARALRPRPATV
ncbi:MAG: hypothetical protein U0324_10240 [Polyangiales bacterium]